MKLVRRVIVKVRARVGRRGGVGDRRRSAEWADFGKKILEKESVCVLVKTWEKVQVFNICYFCSLQGQRSKRE